jgi:hypothetical protein
MYSTIFQNQYNLWLQVFEKFRIEGLGQQSHERIGNDPTI